jgi:enoyl-CoA hydratase/carnithine racemase
MSAAIIEQEQACRLEMAEEGRLWVVTLCRAPNREITPDVLQFLGRLLDQSDAPSGPDLVMVQGEGTVFSKGFDVKVIRGYASAADHRRDLLLGNDVFSRIAASHTPWLAAVNGHCLGGGLELALACHFRLCSDAARLGLPELGNGLLPGLGGIHRLTKLVGRSKGAELMISGTMIRADEALQIGLVNRVLPRQRFSEGVLAFARGILAADRGLVSEVLRLTEEAERLGDDDCVMNTIDCILKRAAL